MADDNVSVAAEICKVGAAEMSAWLEGEGREKIEWFFRKIADLPQRGAIKDADALAFVWSLCHDAGFTGLDYSGRRRIVLSILSGLSSLSPSQAAMVACETMGFRAYTPRAPEAEQIRRRMLLRGLFSFSKDSPEDRLFSLSRRAMLKKAVETAKTQADPEAGLEFVFQMSGLSIRASEASACLLREQKNAMQIWHPCVFDTSFDPFLRLYEMAALACAPNEGEAGFGVAVSINPKDFEISAEIVDRRFFGPFIEKTRIAADDFLKVHVAGDIPFCACEKNGGEELDPESAERFERLCEDAAKLAVLRKMSGDIENEKRKEISRIVSDCAWKRGVPASKIVLPDTGMRVKRMASIDRRGLNELLHDYPDAVEEVCSRAEPSVELMREKLESLGIPPEEWHECRPSAPLIGDFCDRAGRVPPLRETLIFCAPKEKGDLEDLAAKALETLDFGSE